MRPLVLLSPKVKALFQTPPMTHNIWPIGLGFDSVRTELQEDALAFVFHCREPSDFTDGQVDSFRCDSCCEGVKFCDRL